jgi:hypothetical protein
MASTSKSNKKRSRKSFDSTNDHSVHSKTTNRSNDTRGNPTKDTRDLDSESESGATSDDEMEGISNHDNPKRRRKMDERVKDISSRLVTKAEPLEFAAWYGQAGNKKLPLAAAKVGPLNPLLLPLATTMMSHKHVA